MLQPTTSNDVVTDVASIVVLLLLRVLLLFKLRTMRIERWWSVAHNLFCSL